MPSRFWMKILSWSPQYMSKYMLWIDKVIKYRPGEQANLRIQWGTQGAHSLWQSFLQGIPNSDFHKCGIKTRKLPVSVFTKICMVLGGPCNRNRINEWTKAKLLTSTCSNKGRPKLRRKLSRELTFESMQFSAVTYLK